MKIHDTFILARSVSDTYGITYKNSNGVNIYFRDSYKYLGVSIGKLPGSSKIKKEVAFYDRYRNYKNVEEVSQEDYEYLYEDIATQKRNMDEYIRIKKVGVRNYTKTSCAFKEFKSHCDYDKRYKNKITLEEWDYFYHFAVGAYSTGNEDKRNVIIENVISLDVNSLYPDVMYNTWMPYGEPIYGCGLSCDHKCSLLEMKVSGTLKKGYHPTLSKAKKTGESIVWEKEFNDDTIYTTNTYFDVVKEHYEWRNIEVIKKTCFESTWGVAHKFFDEKMKIKEMAAEGSMERLAAKIDMNSCYGRMMMSPYGENWIPELITKHTKLRKNESVYGNYRLRKEIDIHEEIMYSPMGIFILSNARAKTVKLLNTFPNEWVYSDTDSVKFENMDVDKLIKAGVEIHDTKLGAWKYEWKARWYYWQTRKLYFGSDREDGVLKGKMCATSGLNFDKTFGIKTVVKDEKEVLEYMNIWDVYNRKYNVKTTTSIRVNGGIIIKDLEKHLKS